ncbi:hypothetical protein, partial [Alicyclobacillus shizuokensis]
MSRIQLPVAWDPAADCPAIAEFLATVAPPDAIDMLLEFVGYCLIPSVK